MAGTRRPQHTECRPGEVSHRTAEDHLTSVRSSAILRVMQPRPDTQGVALAAIASHFKTHDRALVTASTGWGKSLVGMWAIQQQEAQVVLVCAPTIGLLSQLIQTYQANGLQFDRWIAMCSRNVQPDDVSEEELPVSHTTDPRVLQTCLREHGTKIVFSTYASVPALIAGMVGHTVDMALLDEAHHVAGSADKVAGRLLTDDISIRKRLFMTATPHHVAFDEEEQGFSMDNEVVFGKRVYDMPFREAVNAGIVLPFHVFVGESPVDVEVGRLSMDSKMRAFITVLSRFVKATGCKKLLSKHATIAEADEFRRTLLIAGYNAYTITGDTPATERARIIGLVQTSESIIVTYAECLNEGIDFPSMDAICFMSAVGSVRTIIQASGRVVRVDRANPLKKYGHIVIPALTRGGELSRSAYRHVGTTLQALCEADTSLAQTMRMHAHAQADDNAGVAVGNVNNAQGLTVESGILRQVIVKAARHITAKLDGSLLYTLAEASAAAISLGIESATTYKTKRHMVSRLPSEPVTFYVNWPGWDAFLGRTARITKYETWQEASKAAVALGVTNGPHYRQVYLSDCRLPQSPPTHYAHGGWPGWDAFLERPTKYKTWQEASKAAVALGICSSTAYIKGTGNNCAMHRKDLRLPAVPTAFYADWPGWETFLGKGQKQPKYETWQEASKAAVACRLKSSVQYTNKAFKSDNRLPSDPERYYADWPGWDAFLERPTKYASIVEAASATIAAGITSCTEYKASYRKDPRLPSEPSKYPEWSGWPAFLAMGRAAR